MKVKIIRMMIIILMIVCIPIVHAESTCTYKEKAEAKKMAQNVTAAYEIKQREDGTYYINIIIYNLTDDLYVSYNWSTGKGKYETSSKNTITIFNFDTSMQDGKYTGIYTIEDNDINLIKKYVISVKSTKIGCADTLKTITLTKPRWNPISQIDECKYYDAKDNMYCKEWTSQDFKLTLEGAAIQLRKQRELNRVITPTECYSCEKDEQYNTWMERFNKIRKYAIIGLSIGIVVDLVVIVVLIIKIKEDSIV